MQLSKCDEALSASGKKIHFQEHEEFIQQPLATFWFNNVACAIMFKAIIFRSKCSTHSAFFKHCLFSDYFITVYVLKLNLRSLFMIKYQDTKN